MNFAKIRSFVIRRRISLQDLGLLIAGLSVAAYIAFDVDIFMHERRLNERLNPSRLGLALASVGWLGDTVDVRYLGPGDLLRG